VDSLGFEADHRTAVEPGSQGGSPRPGDDVTRGDTLVAVPLALGAAASFAIANVAQMRAVRRHPPSNDFEPGLLLRLVGQPLWLAGLAASVAGFAFQAAALWLAPVMLVQPLIVAELLFALPLAAILAGGRLGRREWTGALLVTVGLAVFLVIVRPTDAHPTASSRTWVALFVAGTIGVATLLGLGRRSRGMVRTSSLAAAAGVALGLLSVVTKATTHDFSARGVGALGTWEPWVLAVVGVVALSLVQSAFRSGPLAVSLPLMDLGEPLVASLIALVAFGERLGPLGFRSWVELLFAAIIVAVGVAVLDRSPMVQAAQAGLVPAETSEQCQ
jgi:drug/metabolite transporter (DMT)-like permease